MLYVELKNKKAGVFKVCSVVVWFERHGMNGPSLFSFVARKGQWVNAE